MEFHFQMLSKVIIIQHRVKLKRNAKRHQVEKKNRLQIQQVYQNILPSKHSSFAAELGNQKKIMASSFDFYMYLQQQIAVQTNYHILPFILNQIAIKLKLKMMEIHHSILVNIAKLLIIKSQLLHQIDQRQQELFIKTFIAIKLQHFTHKNMLEVILEMLLLKPM